MIDAAVALDFWSRLRKGFDANDCWFVLVKGRDALSKPAPMTDYPIYIRFAGQSFIPHRLSNELAYGPIPPGIIIRHRCANGGCCNPEHHLRGTRHENALDRMVRFRAGIEKGQLATYEDLPEYL